LEASAGRDQYPDPRPALELFKSSILAKHPFDETVNPAEPGVVFFVLPGRARLPAKFSKSSVVAKHRFSERL
jgi:hypothetical protein